MAILVTGSTTIGSQVLTHLQGRVGRGLVHERFADQLNRRSRQYSDDVDCAGRHRDEQERLEFSVAIGRAADMDGRAAQPETGANDPTLT